MLCSKNLLRILSVFLAVVIVSVTFMQPVAYANAIAAGGALVLLVAALLVTCGMVFTSQAQAESTAQYAMSNMPAELLNTLAGSIGGGDPSGQRPQSFPLYAAGWIAGIVITATAYKAFKAWFNTTFCNNEEVWTGGDGVVEKKITTESGSVELLAGSQLVFVRDNGEVVYSPPLPVAEIEALNRSYIYIVDNSRFDSKENDRSFLIYISDHPSRYSASGELPNMYCYLDPLPGNNKKPWTIYRWYINRTGAQWSCMYSGTDEQSCSFGNFSGIYYANYDITSQATGEVVYTPSDNRSFVINEKYGISQEAYNNTIPEDQDVSIALASELSALLENDFRAILEDYSLENWDYSESLELMQLQLDAMCAMLGDTSEYDALRSRSEELQAELAALLALVAAQGADVVGGLDVLSNAMVDAGLVINGVDNLAKAQNRDAEAIAALLTELTMVRQQVEELTRAKEIPENPAIPDAKEGINWAPLVPSVDFGLIFPFCIPFDIIDMIKSLGTTPKAPVFEIPFEMQGVFKEKIIIDLSVVDDIMPFVRVFILLGFVMYLAKFTSNVIKW